MSTTTPTPQTTAATPGWLADWLKFSPATQFDSQLPDSLVTQWQQAVQESLNLQAALSQQCASTLDQQQLPEPVKLLAHNVLSLTDNWRENRALLWHNLFDTLHGSCATKPAGDSQDPLSQAVLLWQDLNRQALETAMQLFASAGATPSTQAAAQTPSTKPVH